MRLRNFMKEIATDVSKVTVDSCCGASLESPAAIVVVWEARIGMLEEGNGN
jgi:hypothetical protein